MINNDYPCNITNYENGRSEAIKYIVIHYVGGNGSAKQNAQYFNNNRNLKASAHYFVGHKSENGAKYMSVNPSDTAWHCGAKKYKHPSCRNANSIGVEMCCHKKLLGKWYFDKETIDATVALVKDLMNIYKIPISNVIRHYDVTGKDCPAPYVADKKAWLDFKTRLTKSPAKPVTPKKPTFEEAVKTVCKMFDLDVEYWSKKKDIDKYFGPMIIKIADKLKRG